MTNPNSYKGVYVIDPITNLPIGSSDKQYVQPKDYTNRSSRNSLLGEAAAASVITGTISISTRWVEKF